MKFILRVEQRKLRNHSGTSVDIDKSLKTPYSNYLVLFQFGKKYETISIVNSIGTFEHSKDI